MGCGRVAGKPQVSCEARDHFEGLASRARLQPKWVGKCSASVGDWKPRFPCFIPARWEDVVTLVPIVLIIIKVSQKVRVGKEVM